MKDWVLEVQGGAYGFFNNTLFMTGWDRGNTQEDEITYFLAGYLEGYLTTG